MKRRLYYMLPDVSSARAMLDELLSLRIEKRHMHFFSEEGALPVYMPAVNFLQKTNLIHGIEVGMVVGAVSGLIAGALFLLFPTDDWQLNVTAVLLATLGGAVLGSSISGMSAASIPNSKLSPFLAGIRQGQVLMIVDVPFYRVAEIEDLISRRHPEISFGGIERHFPIFQ